MDSPLRIACIFLGIVCSLLIARKAFSTKKLPPGPRGFLFVGNALDVPAEKPWVKFAAWAKTYGDIFYITMFGQPWIVVNDFQIAVDLLEKRGFIYSNRPISPMGEMMGWHDGMAFLQYGDRLKAFRRHFQKIMGNPAALHRFDEIEEQESQRFARRLLNKPEGFLRHVEHFAAAVILRVAYGYEVKGDPDPFVELVQTGMKQFADAVTPGRYLVEMVPWLQYIPSWFPGAGFKKTARGYRKIVMRMANEPFNWTRSHMQISEIKSFVSDNLSDETGEDVEYTIKWGATAMYGGGGDTTVASIQSFFFAMAQFPQAQSQAQAEIDRVVGRDRLPNFQDWDNLPYVRALVWEVLRWHSIGPLGLAHRVTEYDVYSGYFIPKGTAVFPNIWSMLHDPEVYRQPDVFNPSRFLKTEHNVPERDPRLICFGFGRRICPGRYMAEASIFISTATILAAFNISKNPKVGLKYEATTSTISHLKPFYCDIKPRSQKAAELINGSLAGENTI
ncbi:hypothetical protein AX16_009914 [Volvariella volvacea WC 439]|nr:hypothetical protein AX16_009914 [Volvariella volvacea WC 439]